MLLLERGHVGVEGKVGRDGDWLFSFVSLFGEDEMEVLRFGLGQMEDVSAVAVGVGGEAMVFGSCLIFGFDLDAGEGEVGHAVSDAAGELPRWWWQMCSPVDEDRGQQEEHEQACLKGTAKGELPAEAGNEPRGGFYGIAFDDALQLDHVWEGGGVEEPRKNGTAQTFGAGVLEGDVLGVPGVLRPTENADS